MVANCYPLEHQVAIFLRDGDQTEISCSATNIADQDQITDFDARSPSITLAVDPGIKRGLRFLEQCDTLQSGKLCGLERLFWLYRAETPRMLLLLFFTRDRPESASGG